MDIEKITQALNGEIVERFKRAIELGKWPDGQPLTAAQRETCLQAVIVYEHQNLPTEQRTAYVPPKQTACDTDHQHDAEQPLNWQ